MVQIEREINQIISIILNTPNNLKIGKLNILVLK